MASNRFIERFPRYTFHLPFWQPVPLLEAVPVIPHSGTKVLYILGLGHLAQFTSWLKEDPTRRLVLLEKEGGRIASFLQQDIAPEILNNEQIEI